MPLSGHHRYFRLRRHFTGKDVTLAYYYAAIVSWQQRPVCRWKRQKSKPFIIRLLRVLEVATEIMVFEDLCWWKAYIYLSHRFISRQCVEPTGWCLLHQPPNKKDDPKPYDYNGQCDPSDHILCEVWCGRSFSIQVWFAQKGSKWQNDCPHKYVVQGITLSAIVTISVGNRSISSKIENKAINLQGVGIEICSLCSRRVSRLNYLHFPEGNETSHF